MVVTVWEGVVTGIWWVEVRDATKHPTVQETASTTKNHAAQKVKSVETGKLF